MNIIKGVLEEELKKAMLVQGEYEKAKKILRGRELRAVRSSIIDRIKE